MYIGIFSILSCDLPVAAAAPSAKAVADRMQSLLIDMLMSPSTAVMTCSGMPDGAGTSSGTTVATAAWAARGSICGGAPVM